MDIFLFDLYRAKFGDHIPLIRRRDVKGFLKRPSFWLLSPLGPEKIRAQAELMEAESKGFYLFGGWLMSQMDLAAGVVAARHAHGRCATVDCHDKGCSGSRDTRTKFVERNGV